MVCCRQLSRSRLDVEDVATMGKRMVNDFPLSVGHGVVFTGIDDLELLEAIVSWYKENLGTLHAITFNYGEDHGECWAVVWYEN